MDIFQEILRALEIEDRVILATIIATTGSTPASAFSKMLIKSQGSVSVGTVGGGCLEGDVLQAAKRLHDSNKAEILTFHLNEDEFVQGLICGGSLDVLVEPIAKEQLFLFEEVQALRDAGEDCIVATFLGNAGVINSKIIVPNVILSSAKQDEESSSLIQQILRFAQDDKTKETILEAFRRTNRRNETQRVKTANGELLLEPISGTPSLIIFGGGHVSRYVCKAAAMAGFRITVVDDREQYANPQRFPDAAQTIATDFPEAFRRLTIKPSTYIVIVTRGHRFDEEILEEALKTSARYIGMIGSKRKVFTTYEHLVERGVAIDSLKRVHAPMGIEIGAVTAEEIGISIVAELIAVRRSEQTPYFNKSVVMQELFSRLEKKYSLS